LKTAVFNIDGNSRFHLTTGTAVPAAISRTAALEKEGCRPQFFNKTAVLLNANTFVLAADLRLRMPASLTLVAGTGDFHPDPDCGELT
jgi:hypothetical protein